MKKCLVINSKRTITAILASAFFLVFIGSPNALADSDKPSKQVAQDSVIKTSPDTLYYHNMFIGVPKSAILTISNISGKDIRITPYMDFGPEYSSFLKNTLEICNSGKCIPVTSDTKTTIAKDKSQELVVTITLTSDLPPSFSAMSLKQGLQVTGEVEGTGEKIEIVPQNRSPNPLANTGIPSNLFQYLTIGLLLFLIGYGLATWSNNRKSKDEQEL